MMDDPQTSPLPALPPRPENGFGAWQATLGYINSNHSPDARLIIYAQPASGDKVLWSGRVAWGLVVEEYANAPSLPIMLARLWRLVEYNHTVFSTPEDKVRRPFGYEKSEWLDSPTQDVLHRLLWTIRLAFLDDWTLMMAYHTIDSPVMRVQMRLIARKNTVIVGGRGASLLDASRDLFRNAAGFFATRSTGDDQTESR